MSSMNSKIETSRPNVLCASCKSYWQRASCLSFTMKELSRGGEGVPSMPQHLLHSQERAEIRSNASEGCHFCSILLGSIVGCTGDHPNRTFFADHSPIYISMDILDQEAGTFLLTLFPCEQWEVHGFHFILNTYPLRLCPKTDLVKTAMLEVYQPSSLHNSTFSMETAEFIKLWISHCKTDHALCGDDHFNTLHGSHHRPRPKRLLDLLAFEDPGRIQLVEAENKAEMEYCALSYSWGFSKPFVMTSSNIVDFQREIHTKELPQTIKDVVQIARAIGVRYLWIDALCIMQDGRHSTAASIDWYDQVNKLHDIFGQSVVTIAASESFDGDQGIIKPRNPLNQIVCQLYPDTKLGYEVIAPCTPHCLYHSFDHARWHLDSRAWVFQERILSPRTAHFTRNFVHLECRTELKCETMSTSGCHHSGSLSKADYQALFSALGMGALCQSSTDFFLGIWHDILRKYSTTNLTRKEDVLLAVAGLAQRIQAQSQLTWSFGLWREHLLRGMLWYVRGGTGTPSRQRAPTWSWASIELHGPHILFDPLVAIRLAAQINVLPETSKFEPQPLLSDYESGYAIKILGQLKPGVPSASTYPGGRLHHPYCHGIGHIHPECPFHPDYTLPENIPLCSVLIVRTSSVQHKDNTFKSYDLEIGLVLTPVAEVSGRYKRVGYFHHRYRTKSTMDLTHQLPLAFFDDTSDLIDIEII
ncbi:HET-domain-containing protein [Pyrenochaeta sp. DS3sAY3a]|nr:HET-domain-containing protein [Pyrenochaeta sp. DS3sAY3a]